MASKKVSSKVQKVKKDLRKKTSPKKVKKAAPHKASGMSNKKKTKVKTVVAKKAATKVPTKKKLAPKKEAKPATKTRLPKAAIEKVCNLIALDVLQAALSPEGVSVDSIEVILDKYLSRIRDITGKEPKVHASKAAKKKEAVRARPNKTTIQQDLPEETALSVEVYSAMPIIPKITENV